MRLWILPAALVGFLVGCNKSPEGGTPGTTASFKLSLPSELAKAKPIKQGTSEIFEGSVERGSGFGKDVKIKVESPDKLDVSVTPDIIKAGDSSTKFNITVKTDKDTPIKNHVIKVTGTPSDGQPTSDTFEVKVTAP